VIAILGGLTAAAMWASSSLCTSRSTRMLPPVVVLGWVLLVGAVISAPFAFWGGVPEALGTEHAGWLVLVTLGNTAGLLCAYSSLRFGKVGVVAPITSAQGAAAAIVAIMAGEELAAGAGIALGAIVIGVVLSSMARGPDEDTERREGLAITFAIAAAAFFGMGLFVMGHLSAELPVAWVLFPTRLLGVILLTVPLALLGRLKMTREALPLVVASGVLEVLGLVAYNVGAREGIAVAAVLASQFAAMAAVAAYFLFRERLARIQVAGVVVIAVGVAILTGSQA